MAKKSNRRSDCVFIRKSTQSQDEQGQISNVQNMLREQGVSVPARNWFVGTVSRRKVSKNADFARLMDLIEADQIGTVYIESQDRWGSADRKELFHLLYILEQHGTRLFNLRAKKDLTESDFATEMLTIVGSLKSEKELQDISYRSLRTRVNNFRDNGSWPTGTHPFGYGKACYAPDGRLLWVFQPISRSRGQVFYADATGKLAPGPENIKIPRKDKRDRIVLVPSNNARYIEAVRMIFDLYVRAGMSRRAISKALNDAGYKFYEMRFTHPLVTNILINPAYVGDTHFGKRLSGELHTFDPNGIVVALKKSSEKRFRDEEERIVRTGTHEPLIEDRKTWEMAQEKIADERKRTSHSPRNPAYYLKQQFRCGHCGKNLTGRTESDRKTGKRTVVYVCGTYIAGRCNGHPVDCGYQSITHDEAELLLLDKLDSIGQQLDEEASRHSKLAFDERLKLIGIRGEAAFDAFVAWVAQGVEALLDYFEATYQVSGDDLEKLGELANRFYEGLGLHETQFDGLKVDLEKFTKAIRTVESVAVAKAEGQLVTLEEESRRYTINWVKATEMQQSIMREEMDRLEMEIQDAKRRAVRLSERVERLVKEESRLIRERRQLIAEYPTMAARERGEAFRRIFKTVTLFWKRIFHPALENPTKPRKTNRPGRYSFELQHNQIVWVFADTTETGDSW